MATEDKKYHIKTFIDADDGDIIQVDSFGLDLGEVGEGIELFDTEQEMLDRVDEINEAFNAKIQADIEGEAPKIEKAYAIADLVAGYFYPWADPRGIDYKTGLKQRLHPEYKFVKGELVEVKYFKNHDGESASDQILNVSISWSRDDDGTLKSRTETRRWALNDGTYGADEKITVKYYNAKEAAIADARRRSNIVKDLTSMAASFGVLSYVQTMFRSLDDELNAYTKTGDVKIIEKIETYSGAWLDAPQKAFGDITLRQAIIGQLTL